MLKKKSNAQNIIIVILCILLLISIAFGVTYSYYNGKTDLVQGNITTANLHLEFHDDKGKTSEFSISAPLGEKYLVPGNNLENPILKIYNESHTKTYIVVVYTLDAYREIKDPETNKTIIEEVDQTKLQNTPALAFKQSGVSSKWKHINYSCQNTNATYTCLVGINPFSPVTEQTPEDEKFIPVLDKDSIKIPVEWGKELMGCNITISVCAYALQADLDDKYNGPIIEAEAIGDMTAKAHAIASAVLIECGVDKAPNNT